MDGKETDTIYLDFSKAFDKVDHQILLKKLKNMGITGKVHDWITNFLKDQQQTVVVDGILSYIAVVISSVPRGQFLALSCF